MLSTHRFAQFLVGVTFLLLLAGGLVTSTDSGLAVPDWPLSYGKFFPPMVGGIRFEHTHRMIAATVGFLTLGLTIWIGLTEKRGSIRWLAIACFGAVVLQGILGGLTVLFRLPAPVSVAHACLGPIFFTLVVALAETTRRQSLRGSIPDKAEAISKLTNCSVNPKPVDCFAPPRRVTRRGARKDERRFAMTARATTVLIFLQILLGSVVRHTGEGIWFHIALAVLIFIFAGFLVTQAFTQFGAEALVVRPALLLGVLVTVEFFLGIGAFAFTRIRASVPPGLASVVIPTLHQTLGAVILATSVIPSLRTRPVAVDVGAGFPRLPDRQAGPQDAGSQGAETAPLQVFIELIKPRLVFLVLWTVAVGFCLARSRPLEGPLLLTTLAGTGLVAAGAMVLNQFLEREADSQMKRTEGRPLPSGRMRAQTAFNFGIALSLLGLLLLVLGVNFLSALLAASTLAIYLFVYTPLKKKTPWCTWVGAIPGAIPPLIGWAAARGTLGLEAWILFAILFVWQLPHFFAIAWIYREDYRRAGFQILSVVDPTGGRIGRQILICTLGLHLVSFLPALAGTAGPSYYLGALLLGIGFIASSFRTAFQLDSRARIFFRNSVLYLFFLLLLMGVDRRFL